MRAIIALAWLVGCGTPNADVLGPQAPAAIEGCPDLTGGGVVALTSNGLDRTATLVLPAVPAPDMPVLFVWHGMGGNGVYESRTLGAQELADEFNAVVVLPRANPSNWLEWGFMNGGEDDLQFVDDLRSCLHSGLSVDLGRFYTTGFSAGGLWSSFLVIHRADAFAAALPFSGGAEPIIDYAPPSDPISVLFAYGGSSDTWGGGGLLVEFEQTTLHMAGELTKDEHTAVVCDHGLGHRMPAESADLAAAFLFAHQWGTPSPFEDGDLTGLPDFCALAQ